MKKTADEQEFQSNFDPSTFSADGFLGTDTRELDTILRTDHATVESLQTTNAAIAEGLRNLTARGAVDFGRPVTVGDRLEVVVEDFRGAIPCPFRDAHHSEKRNTVLTDASTGQVLRWTDLNLHMIERHGFYEGLGSPFRVDPAEVVELLAKVTA